jgi:hypothetical protein
MKIRVPSLSREGESYVVERGAQSELVCECPSFGFSPALARRCKHTDLVKGAQNLIERCHAQHGSGLDAYSRPSPSDAVGRVQIGVTAGLCETCLVAVLAAVMKKGTAIKKDAAKTDAKLQRVMRRRS